MTSREFIAKNIGKRQNHWGLKYCSSVAVNEDGVVYSYGTHYPLATILLTNDGQPIGVVNNSGYSVTTAKHIGWAYSALRDRGIDNIISVKTGDFSISNIMYKLLEEYNELGKQRSKTRSTTKKWANLLDQQGRIKNSIELAKKLEEVAYA